MAVKADISPAFAGFTPETLKFLKALGFHQSKTWFDENRDLYLSALRDPMAAYVTSLSEACAARGLPLRGEAARSMFRLNRDVRFSKDKRPYKTNGGCVLTRTGLKGSPGLLYTHISPEGCFLAAGFFHPEPAELLAMRRAIADKPAAFLAVEKKLKAAGLGLSDGEALTRNPRDFPDVDERVVKAIRSKNYLVRKPIADDLILDGAALVRAAVHLAVSASPLLDFGWAALA